MNPGLLSALALAAGTLAADAPPKAPSPAALAVEVIGQCPSREAVVTALLPVVGGGTAQPIPETPRVSDLGDRFEIIALGQTQQYVDPGRDCGERARVAAVFIALALSPPTFQRRAAPPPPAQVEARPVPPPPAASATSGGWAGVALDARIDGGSAGGDSSATLVAAGADLRTAVGRRALGLVATAGILSPTHSRFQSIPVRQQRFPFSLAVTARRKLSRAFAASAAVGVALVPFTLQGDGLATPAPATRLDAGAHLALALELPLRAGRTIPFVEVHADYFPRPYVIDVDPLGDIGSTGRLWLGVSVGFAIEVRR